MPTRWHIWSEKQLSILLKGRNYARGNRQIIRIPRAFACISAGAPWLWRSVMQIDKVSQELAWLRMLTAPFHGTFFPLEVHSALGPPIAAAPGLRLDHRTELEWMTLPSFPTSGIDPAQIVLRQQAWQGKRFWLWVSLTWQVCNHPITGPWLF